MTDYHTFRIYNADRKTLALIELRYHPDCPNKEDLNELLIMVQEFYEDTAGYEYIGPSNK